MLTRILCRCSTTAVTCLPKSFSHVVNSSDNSVGAVVQVSCPDGQVFSHTAVGDNVTTTCLSSGNWNPDIPDCTGAEA